MPSKILTSVLLLFAAFFGYLTYEFDEKYSIGLIIAVMLIVSIYVFAPQINWWWWMRNPPDLPLGLHRPLEFTPFYQRLSEDNRRIFRQRVFLFKEAQSFMPQAIEKVTDDVKMAISVGAMQVNFHRFTFLYPEHQNIVVYAHPFPSPQYPDHMHASEVFEDEHGNGLIFSIEHVMRSFLEPSKYYNVCVHEYVKLYMNTSKGVNFPKLNDDIWPALEQISGFPHDKLVAYIGLDESEVDPLQVAISHYLVFSDRFRQILPEVAKKLDQIFTIVV